MREQLSTSDNQSNGRILDLKTGTVRFHFNENALKYDGRDGENIAGDTDDNFVGNQVKKEGSQSAMRLCMGSRRGFIARIKVGAMLTLISMMMIMRGSKLRLL